MNTSNKLPRGGFNMKEFAIGIRVDGSQWLTYIRVEGYSIEQVDDSTVIVDGTKITFGEFIERIE